MAYDLQAWIANEATIRTAVPTGAVVVRLPQGKAMIPVSDHVRQIHKIPFLRLTDERFAELPAGVATVGRAIARAGRVVYVEAEFFGGGGTQACVTWDAICKPSQPLIDDHAINSALRFLGVTVGDHQDEFDALGLGTCRSSEEWLKMAECGASPNGGPVEPQSDSSGEPPSAS
jgi:hypothetical protein